MLEQSVFGWTSSVDTLDFNWILDSDLLPLDDDMNNKSSRTDFDIENAWLERLNISSCSASPVHSLSTASSEAGDCSVDFLNGLDDEDYKFVLNTDPVLTKVVTADGCISDPIEPDNWDWTGFPDDSSLLDLPWSESCSESSSVLNSAKRRKTSKSSSSSKSWSGVTNEEQRKAVEALTQIISQELELREKLEVIRIINPKAVVSPTDKEFVVDLACLTDTKFQRIQEYVQKHTYHTSQHWNDSNNKFQSNYSVKSDSSNSSTLSGKLKTSKSKERRNQMKAQKLRQRKEYRQLMKERKSGLFIREEVLSLNTLSNDDDSDIDILE